MGLPGLPSLFQREGNQKRYSFSKEKAFVWTVSMPTVSFSHSQAQGSEAVSLRGAWHARHSWVGFLPAASSWLHPDFWGVCVPSQEWKELTPVLCNGWGTHSRPGVPNKTEINGSLLFRHAEDGPWAKSTFWRDARRDFRGVWIWLSRQTQL